MSAITPQIMHAHKNALRPMMTANLTNIGHLSSAGSKEESIRSGCKAADMASSNTELPDGMEGALLIMTPIERAII